MAIRMNTERILTLIIIGALAALGLLLLSSVTD